MPPTRLPFDVPGAVLSRGRRSVWLAIVALSPLAWFGAAALENRLPHRTPASAIERDRAIDIARDFASGMHIDTSAWTVNVTPEDHETARDMEEATHASALARVTTPRTVEVKLSGPKAAWIVVHLTTAGRVLGFDVSKPERGALEPLPYDRAREIAERYLRAQLGADSPFALRPSTIKQGDKTGWTRDFAWQAAVPGAPATATFHLEVTGDRVTGDSRTLKWDANSAQNTKKPGPWRIIKIVFLAIFYCGFAIYGIVRYVRRSMEKEISHRRTAMVTACFMVAGTLLVALSNQMNVKTDADLSSGGRGVGIWTGLALTFAVMGLFFGVAYGAGEGDLREAYPGKLVSLDAVLSGKIFSANFARSLVAGVAAAAWFLLLQNAFLLVALAGVLGSGSEVLADRLHYPLLALLGEKFTDVAMVMGYGLMLPLTLVRSRIRRPWLVYTLVAILCAIGARGAAPETDQWQVKLALQVLIAGATCLPFFLGDLATSISSVTVLIVVGELLRRSAVSPEWHRSAYNHLLPAAVILFAIEIYFATRGRVYNEEEVRPLYARHLALRQSLAAEIGAARTAQLRLLPDAPPRIAGLTVAGSCTPAREVGGDFFDYYALDDHRLGVFIAEGGNRELGSAMTIALAKGFLMYSARLDLPPVELLRRLRETLGSVLRGENTPISVLYAVIDGHSGSVRYARSGASPRVLLNGTPLAEEVASDRSGQIRHGAATLGVDDALVFFTDGLASQAMERGRQSAEQLLRDLRRRCADGTAEVLHQALVDAVFKRKKEAPPDDVTAVIVCRERRAAEVLEGIA